ncbi:MAG: YkvA family protein [bacterium]
MKPEQIQKNVEWLRKTWKKFNRSFVDETAEFLASLPFETDEEKTKDNTAKILEWLECVPNILLLIGNLMLDDRVPLDGKVRIGAMIFYIVSPLDLLPGWIVGPVGAMDDAVVFLYLLFVLARWLAGIDEEIIYENWSGEQKQIEKIMSFVSKAGELGIIGDVVERGMQRIHL